MFVRDRILHLGPIDDQLNSLDPYWTRLPAVDNGTRNNSLGYIFGREVFGCLP